MGVGRGALPPLNFEIFSKEKLFFSFEREKTKFHHFWPPMEKSPSGPPGKKTCDAHGYICD